MPVLRNPRLREAAFWIAVPLVAGAIVELDRLVAFVYFPRWFLAPPILLFLFPSRVNATYWARVTICLVLVALPFALASVRWNLLKSFYIDCLALEPGIERRSALEIMAPYQMGSPTWGLPPEESGAPTRNLQRVLITPSPEHGADWCILYLDGERLNHVEISPD